MTTAVDDDDDKFNRRDKVPKQRLIQTLHVKQPTISQPRRKYY